MTSIGPKTSVQTDHVQVERGKEVRGERIVTDAAVGDTSTNTDKKLLYVVRFNHSMKFYVKGNSGREIDADENLVISCYDRNPFAPDGKWPRIALFAEMF